MLELKAEGGLIYQRDGDGWTVVASAITGTPRDADLAALLARAPKLEAACKKLIEAEEAHRKGDVIDAAELLDEATIKAEDALAAPEEGDNENK